MKFIITMMILSILLLSCAKEDDSSSTTNAGAELGDGTWVTSCHASGDYYRIKKLTVSGTNFTNTNEYHTDSSCATDYDMWSNEWGSLTIGAARSDGSGNRFTLTLTDITYKPQTSGVVSWTITNRWCSLTNWVLNTANSVAGKTCGSSTQWGTGKAVYGEYLIDGNDLYWDYDADGYPSVSSTSGYYKFTKSSTSSSTSTSSSSGFFIAVGASGTLLTSPDGTTWTAQTSGTSNNLRSVAYNGSSTLVAVGYSGTILTSSDNGTTWTSRTSGTSNDINNIAYHSSGIFGAVGDNGTLLTSPDGTTWTDKTSSCGMTENMWDIDVTNSSIGVVIGDNGSIYTSTDQGDDCTKRTSGTTVEFNELIYGNSTYAAFGDNGTIRTSSNGITWDNRTSGTTNNLYGGTYSVTTSGIKLHIAVGQSGIYVWSSDNGSSWTTWSPSITNDIYGFAHGKETSVFVGSSGTIYTAADGANDVTARTSGTSQSLRRVFYIE